MATPEVLFAIDCEALAGDPAPPQAARSSLTTFNTVENLLAALKIGVGKLHVFGCRASLAEIGRTRRAHPEGRIVVLCASLEAANLLAYSEIGVDQVVLLPMQHPDIDRLVREFAGKHGAWKAP